MAMWVRCAPLAFAFIGWCGVAPLMAAERPPQDVEVGRTAYVQSCARCHGATAHGDGLDAKRFYPRPRDLTTGVYKFRSTASGTPPSDDDLFRTISHGLPGSNMPDWQHLDEPVRWHLVDYLKSLSPIFQQTQPMPVTVAADPGPARAERAKGKGLYESLGCAACHGPSGRANGPSAAGLVDDWGMPVRPADLTKAWAYRGGSDPRSIMLRVLTGIDGAGMPSYAEALSSEDAWHLAYYVESLQEPAHLHLIAHAQRVDGELPATVDDPRWNAAERTDVPVRNAVGADGQWSAPATILAVAFQAVFNDDAIAFRFLWNDPTEDRHAPRDALALALKPEEARGDVVTLQAWPTATSPTLDLCVWSAQTGRAMEMMARDWAGAVTGTAHDVAELAGAARYADGRWQMVVQRPLGPHAPRGAAVITPQTFTSIAMAVWDGGNATARAVSPWVDVMLRTSRRVR